MAENKKSVLLYCDLIHTVEKLDNETAGELFKHYLRYINDLDPKTESVLVDVVFEPIKQNLKRDLKKWEDKIDKRSEAGKKSAAKKQFDKWLKEHPEVYKISKDDHLFEKGRCEKHQRESWSSEYTVDYYYYGYCIEFHNQMSTKSTSVEIVKQNTTNSTVKDTVIVTVKDKVIVKDTINNRMAEFKNSLQPFLEVYGSKILNDFYLYWTEKKPKGRKMLFEMQKTFDVSLRLKRWKRNDFNKASDNLTATQKLDKALGL